MLVSRRRCVPILRVKPQLVQNLKEIVCAAVFDVIGVPRSDLTSDLCKLWLEDLTYMMSERCSSGLVAAVAAYLRAIGAEGLISRPICVGGQPVLSCLLGHWSLTSSFVQSTLEAKLEGSHRRVIGEGIYEQWRAELVRADIVMPDDDRVHFELILVDGHDARRSILDFGGPGDSEDPESVDDEEEAAPGEGAE